MKITISGLLKEVNTGTFKGKNGEEIKYKNIVILDTSNSERMEEFKISLNPSANYDLPPAGTDIEVDVELVSSKYGIKLKM